MVLAGGRVWREAGQLGCLTPVPLPHRREEHHPSVPYHYFEKGRLDECQMYLAHERAPRSAHRFITEKAVFSRWAKKRPIVFAHPSWRTQWPHRHSAITRPLLQPHSAKNT